MNNPTEWLKRAKSNLSIAKNFYDKDFEIYGGDVYFEELCFEIQQSVEKSFKAVLLFYTIEFPKTHDIDRLIKTLKLHSKEVPEELLDAGTLTQYAVRTRYPDNVRKITQEEYKEALVIAEKVYHWAHMIIEN